MKIVVLDGFTLNPGDISWAPLESLGDVEIHNQTQPAEVAARGKDADVLVINKIRISKEHLQRMPEVKMIAVTATGYDCVDTGAARKKSVVVCNVPEYGTTAVAQFVFAQLLHLCHRVDLHDQAVRGGEWEKRGDFSFSLTTQTELTGLTMGIVGLGRIGRQVARLGDAFGMRVVAHSRTEHAPLDYAGFAFMSLDELAREADVISLHCPLTHQTNGMIDANFLSKCKSTTVLINASRGALVNEVDLANALTTGKIAGAALDVVSMEPIGLDNPLLAVPNCTITPHMAWASRQARLRLMETTAGNIAAYQNGSPQNVVSD